MPTAVQLEACPLCRTTLRGGEQRCPGCGAELNPYLDNLARSEQLLSLAREWLTRGQPQQAAALLPHASRLTSTPPQVVAELEARIALAQGNYGAVRDTLARLDPAAAAAVQAELAQAAERQRRARELYNQALTAARQGSFTAAAHQLARGVELDPADAALWQLKLKCDLKARRLHQCYEDLAALDRLGARPLGFARLETLLPPSLPA